MDTLVDALLAPVPAARRRFDVARSEHPRGLVADTAPIAPQDIARTVNDLIAANGPMIIASDVGDCLFTAIDMDAALVAPGYYATMGFGVPAGSGCRRRADNARRSWSATARSR